MRIYLVVPVVLLALLVGLATLVWQGSSSPIAKPIGGMSQLVGGKPQGHVYTGAVEEPADVNPFTACVESEIFRWR